MKQPGGREPIQQMPEHMGCAHGTAAMVHDACERWLRGRGMMQTQQEIKNGLFKKRKRKKHPPERSDLTDS